MDRRLLFWLRLPALAGLALLAAAGGRPAAAGLPPATPDPFSLYGETIEFDVLRNGEPVGRHLVRFARDGGDLVVSSRFRLEVKALFVTVYRYEYESEGRWRDGQLQALRARIDDDGARSSVEARRHGAQMTVRGEDGVVAADSPLFPTNHWNAAVLPQRRVLNTLTGRVNEVQIKPAGRERVETEWGPVSATRYVYHGELATEVWYDDAGRWVGMRFRAGDGSVIDYRCRRCQGPRLTGANG